MLLLYLLCCVLTAATVLIRATEDAIYGYALAALVIGTGIAIRAIRGRLRPPSTIDEAEQ